MQSNIIAGSASSDSRQTNAASSTQIPRNRVISSSYSSDDINRFVHDEEVRSRLLNVIHNIDIHETSQLYSNKSRKNSRSTFEPRVILLKKRGSKNRIPKEGTSE